MTLAAMATSIERAKAKLSSHLTFFLSDRNSHTFITIAATTAVKRGTQVPLTAWAVYAPMNVPQKPMNIATIAQSAKLFFPVPLPFESIFWHLVEYFLQK